MNLQNPNPIRRDSHSGQTLPWYRYPWPWVAIAIPAIAVIGGLYTLYLAISHPDPLVVDDHEYRELRTELRAEAVLPGGEGSGDPARDEGDGEL